MDPEELIEKLDWLFKSPLSSNRYNTQEFKEEQFRFFENYVHFLQDNGFTTRILLKKGEKASIPNTLTPVTPRKPRIEMRSALDCPSL